MLHELVAALALLAVVAATSGVALAATPPLSPAAVSWSAQMLGGENVSLGSPLSVGVWGPPSGTFNVTLAGAPPLSTAVFFAHSYTEPNRTSNATLGALVTVSIPTSGLAYGPYSLAVANTSLGFEFAAFTPHLDPGVNATYLLGQLLYLESLYNATRLSEMNQAATIVNLENMVTGLEYTVLGVAIGCVVAVAYWRTGESWGLARRGIEGVRDYLHGATTSVPNSDAWRSLPLREQVGAPDASRTYISRAYLRCALCLMPGARAEKERHLVVDHHRDPVEAKALVEPSIPEMRRVADATHPTLLTRRAYRKAMKATPKIVVAE